MAELHAGSKFKLVTDAAWKVHESTTTHIGTSFGGYPLPLQPYGYSLGGHPRPFWLSHPLSLHILVLQEPYILI